MVAVQLLASLFVLSCGAALVWWRRDNVLAYVPIASFVPVYVISLFPMLEVYRSNMAPVQAYADILALGAVTFVVGLALGRQIALRSRLELPLTFDRPVTPSIFELVRRRARWIAAAGILGMFAAFVVMGYVPVFAADRVSAKYGVGAYRESFERGALLFRFGLAASALILPVMLATFYKGRRMLDLGMCILLLSGLVFSLSRDAAFIGPLAFGTAVLVERRVPPVLIAGLLAAVFSVGALVTLLFLEANSEVPEDVAARIAASTADIRDHLGFLREYEKRPEPTYGRTLLAGLLPRKSEWDASSYSLRIITGLPDATEVASGGLRMPAPLWGYVSFGWGGAAMFAAVSGVFTGWGFARLKRLLTPALGTPGFTLNLMIAMAFYEATFGLLAEFYFLTSSSFVKVTVGGALALAVRVVFVRGTRRHARGVEPPQRLAAARRQGLRVDG